MEIKGKKKTALIALAIIFGLLFQLVFFTNIGYQVGQKEGFKAGYLQALSDVSDKTGITFEWRDLGDGRYEILAYYEGGLYAKGVAEVHLWIEHWRDGKLLSSEYGAGLLMNTTGKDWIEKQLSGTLNSSQHALYCSDSNSADSPVVTWTVLPNEITANGLDRQTGAYTSTGVGTWNVSVTKSVTGTQSTQLWGLNSDPGDNTDGYLIAADSGPSQKNCVSGDTLKETWQITVT